MPFRELVLPKVFIQQRHAFAFSRHSLCSRGKAELSPHAPLKTRLPPIGLAAKTQLAEQRGGAKITRVHHRSNTVLRQRPEQQSDDGAQRPRASPRWWLGAKVTPSSAWRPSSKKCTATSPSNAVLTALDRQLEPAVVTVERDAVAVARKGLRIGGAVVAPALIARHVRVTAVGGKVGADRRP